MNSHLTPYEALQLAVERAGSQSEFARICGVGQPAVWKWLDSGKRLPAEHVLKIEAATGVSRHDLRPDIYPRGLQDDCPFCPPTSRFLTVDRQPVACERRVELQGIAA